MAVQTSGITYEINGNEVIGYVKAKDLKKSFKGFIDLTTMKDFYEQDPLTNHLGMVNSWQSQGMKAFPIYQDLLKTRSVIEVDGFDGEFTYDVPVYKNNQIETTGDTSDQLYAGIDGSTFLIELSEEFSPNDVLTADSWYNENQIVVDDQTPVRQTGTGYMHTVKATSFSKEKTYPTWLLKPGIKYTKLNNVGGEFTTQFSKVQLPSKASDLMRARFKLQGIRGVEGMVTAFADKKKLPAVYADQIQELVDSEAEMRGGDVMIFGDYSGNPNSPFKKNGNLRAGTLMENLVHRHLEELTAKSLMWQKGGVIRDTNGQTYLNEGLWHQLRRGKLIRYNRPGGITVAILQQATEYVFQANTDLPVEKRRIHFKCGKGAYDNITALFQEQALLQLQRLAGLGLMGTDRALPKSPISGDLAGLTLAPVMFKEIFIPSIGTVTIEHDPSLDWEPGSDFQLMGHQPYGRGRGTWTAVIWDVTDGQYSNNKEGIKASNFSGKVVEGGNSNANIFLVKPEGVMNYWGSQNGRWDGGKAYIQQGGLKHLAQEFFAFNSSAIWVKDPSKFVMIELTPYAQTGLYYGN